METLTKHSDAFHEVPGSERGDGGGVARAAAGTARGGDCGGLMRVGQA